MNWRKIVNTFILGGIGVIFSFDAVAYVFGNETISENITHWINDGNTGIFWAIVIVLSTHFAFGKYKK
jgi:Na+/H+ antiporter NhaA